jgi:hypothetical protein
MNKENPYVCQHPDCNFYYKDPIMLPCGSTICKEHLDKVDDNKIEKCWFCNEEHLIPENGFVINKTVDNIMRLYYHLDPLHKEVIKSFDDLELSIENYEKINPEEQIFDYFGQIQNRVDLHRESLIKQINDKSDEITKTLKEKEKKCQDNMIKLSKQEMTKLKSESLTSWKHQLRNPNINQNELNSLKIEMNQNISKIQKEEKIYKSELILHETIEFIKHENSSMFGYLQIKPNNDVIQLKYSDQSIVNQNVTSSSIQSSQLDGNSNFLLGKKTDKKIKGSRLNFKSFF